jgi:hypothetical protein
LPQVQVEEVVLLLLVQMEILQVEKLVVLEVMVYLLQ